VNNGSGGNAPIRSKLRDAANNRKNRSNDSNAGSSSSPERNMGYEMTEF
jgi:hypothetical protein